MPALYPDRAMFDRALAKAEATEPAAERLHGITVPHHLIADHLIAQGFKAASAHRYRRVIVIGPDHFRAAERPIAISTHGFETPYGPIAPDAEAAGALLRSAAPVEASCLFARDHGTQALLPFIRHHFPEAAVLAVALSIRSTRADWDALIDALLPLIDDDTLIVESTDFSHYLPHHEARIRDQQTLNVLAAGSLDQLAALTQPDHADSVGALYVQVRLQRARWGAAPSVLASENQQQYTHRVVAETTSYLVLAFGPDGYRPERQRSPDVQTFYLAGDVNFGRAMKVALLDEWAARRIETDILQRTGGRPLIVNLEGVILPNVPAALDDMTLAMPEDLAIRWLKALNVTAANLANNHARDLGDSGLSETRRALRAAGITTFGNAERIMIGPVDIIGFTDLDSNAAVETGLLTDRDIRALAFGVPQRPQIAFVHWGEEYAPSPGPRELDLADRMRRSGAAAVVGAHPHVRGDGLTALAGGETLLAYSLGNFLFDQTGAKASGSLAEVTAFPQGTITIRLMPIPNYFDMARDALAGGATR